MTKVSDRADKAGPRTCEHVRLGQIGRRAPGFRRGLERLLHAGGIRRCCPGVCSPAARSWLFERIRRRSGAELRPAFSMAAWSAPMRPVSSSARRRLTKSASERNGPRSFTSVDDRFGESGDFRLASVRGSRPRPCRCPVGRRSFQAPSGGSSTRGNGTFPPLPKPDRRVEPSSAFHASTRVEFTLNAPSTMS